MAQKKAKKTIKVRDLKPAKDVKGGSGILPDRGGHRADYLNRRVQ
jgi:hypothetical protein